MAGSKTDDGVQILRVLDDHAYQLDEEKLRKILLRPDVKDSPVAVVSVAGTYRTGKSFLLDFFLRYCKATPEDRENNKWLGRNTETLEGFKWQGGSERATNGIHLWPEPFHMKLDGGQNVAVILMDTQGTFDSMSTVRDCSTIFALSTLLSSVQIYNIVGNIKEDDLQHLELFTRYGILAKDQDGSTPFQVLQFLVRDWMSPYEYPYGAVGGDSLLQKRLEAPENQHPDLRVVREQIKSCFESVGCFLMPHPGFGVTCPNFQGRLDDLQPEFKESLKELIPPIFESYLAPRIINGIELKCKDLFHYFKSYTSIFSGNDLPEPVTILKAISAVSLVLASRNANEAYEEYMNERCGSDKLSTTTAILRDINAEAVGNALKIFTAKKQLNPEEAQAEVDKLKEIWKARFIQLLSLNKAKTESAINAAKTKYDSVVFRQYAFESLCLHPSDLVNDHEEAVQEAMKEFDKYRTPCLESDSERESLLEELQSNLNRLKNMNDQNNTLHVNEAVESYRELMESAFGLDSYIKTDILDAKHEEGSKKAIEYFISKRNRFLTLEDREDGYIHLLKQKIEELHDKFEAGNKNAIKTAIQRPMQIYNIHISKVWTPEYSCLHPDFLEILDKYATEKALAEFDNYKSSLEGAFDSAQEELIKTIRCRYRDLCDRNDKNNMDAVNAATDLYCRTMDLKCSKFLLSNLVNPWLREVIAKIPQYHVQTKKEAWRFFLNKRRPSPSKDDTNDKFMLALNSNILREYENYKWP